MKSSPAHKPLVRSSVLCLIVCVVVPWIASPASAWGPAGHRIIASVAQEHLNARARARLAYVLGSETTLADVATWADDVRDERPETATWHYINIPPAATNLRPQRDCPDGNCVSDKIREFVGIARLGIRGKSEVGQAVKFLIHFVGDLHQPLHAGFAEDKGGNQIPVMAALKTRFFWQLAIGTSLGHLVSSTTLLHIDAMQTFGISRTTAGLANPLFSRPAGRSTR